MRLACVAAVLRVIEVDCPSPVSDLVACRRVGTHDSEGLKPMVEGHRTRNDPHCNRYFQHQRLHADKAYDRSDPRKWLRGKRIGVRLARKGIESSERLGRRGRVIERTTMSWLSQSPQARRMGYQCSGYFHQAPA
ncbi:hypothetical protein Sliba_78510 [Streptomyces nigrescens]|uniref:Transposase IS4-like domain-containing protein n=1 Tax=Streptomyces nigrescens TaxID=1920 RepID=A0A640TUU2_STRNI|nr:hypothetical protein Sliba_78510 [Streptomyces libani subsp. libani]GGV96251.1 hypothetical protein GCM10010500_38560 [Streptomyces libani subsp. libani]